MALTLAAVEQIAVSRTRGFLAQCGMALTTAGQSAPNADLADAIGSALRARWGPPVNPVQPVDTDLQGVADADEDLFLGVVQLFTLRACWGRWAKWDAKISLGEQKLGQLAGQIQSAHDRLAADLLARYGFGRRRRRHPRLAAILRGNVWPAPPPPPLSPPPWPAGYSPPPCSPPGAPSGWGWGWNP